VSKPTFDAIVRDLWECGYIRRFEKLSDNCYETTCTMTWRVVAKEASLRSGGCWHPYLGGLRWQNGNKAFYLIKRNDKRSTPVSDLMRYRNIVEEVTGLSAGWSAGSCATKLLQWAFDKHEADPDDKTIINGGFIGYHECTPDHYDHASMYDAKSCYYQLIKRLPSPKAGITRDGKLRFDPMRPDEKSKWSEVIAIVEEEKLLRNSLWGVMLGCNTPKTHYHKGECKEDACYFGHSFAAAALVARSAWELCRDAAEETDAVYAQTDGIIVAGNKYPTIWDSVGLIWSLKHSGKAHTVHQHNYKIGDHQTEFYSESDYFKEYNPRAPRPERLYYREWLA
jgi:hypothetical protein